MDCVAVGEASARGVLHTPGSAAGRPLDASPQLPVDGQLAEGSPSVLPEAGFDNAIAPSVCGLIRGHVAFPPSKTSSTSSLLSKCHRCHKAYSRSDFPHFDNLHQ